MDSDYFTFDLRQNFEYTFSAPLRFICLREADRVAMISLRLMIPSSRSPSKTGKPLTFFRRINVAAASNVSFGLAIWTVVVITAATGTRSGCVSRAFLIAWVRHRLLACRSRVLT